MSGVRTPAANGHRRSSASPTEPRFEIVRPLATAPGLETALARDLALDRLVVVRRLTGPGAAAARVRLEQEAVLLGDSAGAALALPIEVLDAAEGLSVVRPFVSGMSLEEL